MTIFSHFFRALQDRLRGDNAFTHSLNSDPPSLSQEAVPEIASPPQYFPTNSKEFEELLSSKRYSEACASISHEVLLIIGNKETWGKQVYLPEQDKIAVSIGRAIIGCSNLVFEKTPQVPLIVATELYNDGGHTRIIEELVEIYPNALIILTNYFEGSSRNICEAPRGIKNLPILSLPFDSVEKNIKRLFEIAQRHGSPIFHLAHQHDVLANAALSQISCTPVFCIHHSDHKASLGVTIENFIHVDMAKHVHKNCLKELSSPIDYWPQGVKDRGSKAYSYPLSEIVTCCSGSHTKFDWHGDLSYPQLIVTLLASGVSQHFHIGELPPLNISIIKSTLDAAGISLNRINFIGTVPSLWESLLVLPITHFIGSAPIHGLRTAIEVQGAGIPLFPYLQQSDGRYLHDGDHYNKGVIFWKSPSHLASVIKESSQKHRQMSEQSREFYLNNFSADKMREEIERSILDFNKSGS